MDFNFAQLKAYLDGRFAKQEKSLLKKIDQMIDKKLDQKLDEKLEQKFDEFEGRMMAEFGSLRNEMHNGFAAVAETISKGHDYHEKRYANHERRIVSLEQHSA